MAHGVGGEDNVPADRADFCRHVVNHNDLTLVTHRVRDLALFTLAEAIPDTTLHVLLLTVGSATSEVGVRRR